MTETNDALWGQTAAAEAAAATMQAAPMQAAPMQAAPMQAAPMQAQGAVPGQIPGAPAGLPPAAPQGVQAVHGGGIGQTGIVAGMSAIEPMLAAMVQHHASDLLLAVGTPPRARIDGHLQPLRAEPMTPGEVRACVAELLNPPRLAAFETNLVLDFSFSWNNIRFRGNAFHAKEEPALSLRHLAGVIPTPESLGVPQSVIGLTERPHGLVLVTGPTGSGKSTTIAALVERINQTKLHHIITLEDPIEYEFTHARSVVNQREIGRDVNTFAEGLRSVLREDPDVVLVGEMRDLESIASAITVAETGHLVFGTLHTNDAAQAIDRIIDVFPAEQQRQIRAQLSAAILSVIHQRLIPRRGGGRVAAYEVLLATEPVRNLIREGKTNQLHNVISQSALDGMLPLEKSIEMLRATGIID